MGFDVANVSATKNGKNTSHLQSRNADPERLELGLVIALAQEKLRRIRCV